jgi:hypothetical protein
VTALQVALPKLQAATESTFLVSCKWQLRRLGDSVVELHQATANLAHLKTRGRMDCLFKPEGPTRILVATRQGVMPIDPYASNLLFGKHMEPARDLHDVN